MSAAYEELRGFAIRHRAGGVLGEVVGGGRGEADLVVRLAGGGVRSLD